MISFAFPTQLAYISDRIYQPISAPFGPPPMPKKYVEERREIKLSLPSSLITELDLMFFDPVRGRPRHGARSEFVSRAIHAALTLVKSKEPSSGHEYD